MPSPPHAVANVAERLASVPGSVLTGVFGAVSRLRATAKPLHPYGRLLRATVHRNGLEEPLGVPWIDQGGTSQAQVRLSRAIGLPDNVPDIHGLALRLPLETGGHADLLFATTGLGMVSRIVLLPGMGPESHAYSTLLPYRTPTGPLLLAAKPNDDDANVFTLSCARPGGSWRPFAYVEIAQQAQDEDTGNASVSFDPVANQLPGLAQYDWARRLRAGSYAVARRMRGDDRAKP